MPQEIERKFLVKGEYKSQAFKSERMTQGYLSSVPERTVRIRLKGEQAFITIKGATNTSGTSRYEWEKEIPTEEARELLSLCESGVIDKTRHLVKVGASTFEVDEFHDKNEGLTIAEIELASENAPYEKPDWLGKEVTGDNRYYNSMLSKYPFSTWNKQ